MGTRNLVIVKLDNKIKVAQYGQWDGYFTGQGITIAKFLAKLDLKNFKKQVKALSFIADAEIDRLWKVAGADESGTISMDKANAFGLKYPEFSRDTGAGILSLIAKGQVTQVQNNAEFIKDALFCEYAYVLDLNKKTVTIHHGYKTRVKTTIAFKAFTVKAMRDLDKSQRSE